MKTVPMGGKIAAGRVALVDDSDYELVMRYRWHAWEETAPSGNTTGPYAMTSYRVDGRVATKYMHQLLIPGAPEVDHKDGNGLNNQRSNLRAATSAQNQANKRSILSVGGKPASSRFKGLCWFARHQKWQVNIRVNGKRRFLGYFADEIEAALAYDVAAREAWGEYAWLNFPDSHVR